MLTFVRIQIPRRSGTFGSNFNTLTHRGATSCSRTRSIPRSIATTSRRNEQQLITDVFTHWYGSTTVERFATLGTQMELWYGGKKEADDDIRERFGEDVDLALNGGWDQLIGGTENPLTGELALVVMLDQYTRNVFRGTAAAFSGDEKAIKVAASIVSTDRWLEAREKLAVVQCSSFLLPYMHQEKMEHLDTLIEKATGIISDLEKEGEKAKDILEMQQGFLKFANQHRDIIASYGRYPYRNKVLGRTSTPAELKFLEEGPRFGQ